MIRSSAGWLSAAGMLLLASALPAKPARRPLTPAMVHQQIVRFGVDRFVERAYDYNRHKGRDWYEITAHIERGEAEWMPIVRELARMEAPVAPAEELDTALGLGLSKAPQNVLPLLSLQERGSLTVRSICRAPIPAPGKQWLIRYEARTLKALQSVQDPKLAGRKAACIRTLRAVDTSGPADGYE